MQIICIEILFFLIQQRWSASIKWVTDKPDFFLNVVGDFVKYVLIKVVLFYYPLQK